jgi:hypothetical protein
VQLLHPSLAAERFLHEAYTWASSRKDQSRGRPV